MDVCIDRDRELSRWMERPRDAQVDRQIDQQTEKKDRQMDGWMDRQMDSSTFQPSSGPSMETLCHPGFTTTKLSYRFPIFETSATILRGTTGNGYCLLCLWAFWLFETIQNYMEIMQTHAETIWKSAEIIW